MKKSELDIWSCLSLRNLSFFYSFVVDNEEQKLESMPAKGVPSKYPTNWLAAQRLYFQNKNELEEGSQRNYGPMLNHLSSLNWID